MTITFNSTADTAEIAAENAIMLSQDTGQVVNLVWKGCEALVCGTDHVSVIETLLLNPSLDSAAPLAGATTEDLAVLDAAWHEAQANAYASDFPSDCLARAEDESSGEPFTFEDEDQTPRWSCAPDDAFPVLFC